VTLALLDDLVLADGRSLVALTPRPGYENTFERIVPRLRLGPGGCWLWTGCTNPAGYGVARSRSDPAGLSMLVHRRLWTAVINDVPASRHIDHLCRVHACANLDHLEVVTPRENCMRGVSPRARQAKQTHCIHGHLFDEKNTYRYANGRRDCLRCAADRMARKRAASIS
jgi:hypothetical protein